MDWSRLKHVYAKNKVSVEDIVWYVDLIARVGRTSMIVELPQSQLFLLRENCNRLVKSKCVSKFSRIKKSIKNRKLKYTRVSYVFRCPKISLKKLVWKVFNEQWGDLFIPTSALSLGTCKPESATWGGNFLSLRKYLGPSGLFWR